MRSLLALLLCSLLFQVPTIQALAQSAGEQAELDAALKKVDAMLKSPEARQAVIEQSKGAGKSDAYVSELTGNDPALQQKIYELSSEVMTYLMKDQGKSPANMADLLEGAKTNPSGFGESLPPEIKEKIRVIAAEIEKKKKLQAKP